MIGAIYSLLNKLWRLLSLFSRTRNAIYWGNGEEGNVYIGTDKSRAPAGYSVIEVQNGETYTFPESALLRYNNLIIDCPCTFKITPVVIQATDSITVTEYGHLSVDDLGTNAREAHFLYVNNGDGSPILQLSNATGASTSPEGTLLIRTYFANNLPTNYRVYLSGASANNKGIANGGTSGASGGLVMLYTTVGGLTAADTHVTASGARSGGNGGGMLSIMAPKITVEGKITANGSSNSNNIGVIGKLNYVPPQNNDASLGGAGLAMSFEIPVDRD